MFKIHNFSGKVINFALVSGGSVSIPEGETSHEKLVKKGQEFTKKDLNSLVVLSQTNSALKVELTGEPKQAKDATVDVSKLAAEKDEALAKLAESEKAVAELKEKLAESEKAGGEQAAEIKKLKAANTKLEKAQADSKEK